MGIDQLLNKAETHAGPVEAIIATAPESVNDPVWVYVTGDDDTNHREGPCAWIARVDNDIDKTVQFPEEGDSCAVAVTDGGTPIVIAWWTGEWPGG